MHTLSRMTDDDLLHAYAEAPKPNIYGTELLRRQRQRRAGGSASGR